MMYANVLRAKAQEIKFLAQQAQTKIKTLDDNQRQRLYEKLDVVRLELAEINRLLDKGFPQ